MYNTVKSGNVYDYNYKKFVCDTISDMDAINTEELAAGSSAIVLKAETGQAIYILSNEKKWIPYSTPASSGGATGGLDFDNIASVEDTQEYLGI